MASSEDRIRVVLVSPGDVAKERAAARAVIEELNRGVATNRLVLWGWDTDARPGLHREGPQGLIDDLMAIQAADVVIGVFWTRFGSPTHDATSGTEHELRRAWDAWRQSGRPEVMVYFSTRPYAATQPGELTQWQRVLEFKRELPSEQLWWQYTTPRDFERLLRVHLTRYVLDRDRDRDRDRGSARRTLGAEVTPFILPSALGAATPDRPEPGARATLGLRRRRDPSPTSVPPTDSSRKRWLLVAAAVTSALLLIAAAVALLDTDNPRNVASTTPATTTAPTTTASSDNASPPAAAPAPNDSNPPAPPPASDNDESNPPPAPAPDNGGSSSPPPPPAADRGDSSPPPPPPPPPADRGGSTPPPPPPPRVRGAAPPGYGGPTSTCPGTLRNTFPLASASKAKLGSTLRIWYSSSNSGTFCAKTYDNLAGSHHMEVVIRRSGWRTPWSDSGTFNIYAGGVAVYGAATKCVWFFGRVTVKAVKYEARQYLKGPSARC